MGLVHGLRLEGISDGIARVRGVPLDVLRRLPEGVRNVAKMVRDEARRGVSGAGGPQTLARRTGGFYRSIRFRKAGTAQYTVGSNHPAARIHEFGGVTPPHVIRPRNASALRFQIGGRTVFAKKVNHPGSIIPPRPWLRPASTRVRSQIDASFRGVLDQALLDAGYVPARGPLGGYRLTGTAKRTFAQHSAEVDAAAANLMAMMGGG